MLDIECFTYLNRALESTISPIVIFASNRGICTIRGTDDIQAPHGIPTDLLDRLLIIRTLPYTVEEIRLIVRLRAKTEGLNVTEAALDALAAEGENTSLRYALQLMTPASIVAKMQGRDQIDVKDITECRDLFLDARRSAKIVREKRLFVQGSIKYVINFEISSLYGLDGITLQFSLPICLPFSLETLFAWLVYQ